MTFDNAIEAIAKTADAVGVGVTAFGVAAALLAFGWRGDLASRKTVPVVHAEVELTAR